MGRRRVMASLGRFTRFVVEQTILNDLGHQAVQDFDGDLAGILGGLK